MLSWICDMMLCRWTTVFIPWPNYIFMPGSSPWRGKGFEGDSSRNNRFWSKGSSWTEGTSVKFFPPEIMCVRLLS